MTVGDETKTLGAGDVVVINRGIEHELYSEGGMTFVEALAPVLRDHVPDAERDLVLGEQRDSCTPIAERHQELAVENAFPRSVRQSRLNGRCRESSGWRISYHAMVFPRLSLWTDLPNGPPAPEPGSD